MKQVLAILCGVVVLNASAGDWRQFRGPQGAGVAADAHLPTSLNADQNMAWKTALAGRGHSTAIVVGERVFVTCSSGGQGERLHVFCFSAADGHKIWERQFWATGRTTCHEKISVAGPSPASDGERVFALFSSNDLFCLDLNGNLLWLRGLMRDYPNASNGLGLSASPVVADGVLVAQIETDGDAFAVGVDAVTGVNRWKIARPRKANWTSPLVMGVEGGSHRVALQSSAGVSLVEAATGREVWNYAEGASTVPSSALKGDVLYVPSSGITALQGAGDGQPPKQLWRAAQLRPATASPLVLGDQIFTLNDAGVLTCGATADGARLWQLRLKGPFSASPLAAGKFIYLVNEKGLLQVVDPSKPDGEVVGELDLKETIIGTPSISGDAIYIRSDGHLWKIGRPVPKVS